MSEKLFLRLIAHSNDRLALDRMVEQAAGDVEEFRRLYKERYNFAAKLVPEGDPHYLDGLRHEGVMAVN